jgi:hypothetical protein
VQRRKSVTPGGDCSLLAHLPLPTVHAVEHVGVGAIAYAFTACAVHHVFTALADES